ncbi:hypothetical protein FWD20_02340 [Candidatus Saccharibacteria bacterium]|nr:hypothetical protein [Candidatus Saccharibacteria bacterium]
MTAKAKAAKKPPKNSKKPDKRSFFARVTALDEQGAKWRALSLSLLFAAVIIFMAIWAADANGRDVDGVPAIFFIWVLPPIWSLLIFLVVGCYELAYITAAKRTNGIQSMDKIVLISTEIIAAALVLVAPAAAFLLLITALLARLAVGLGRKS